MAVHKTPNFSSLEELFYYETVTKAQLFEMVREFVSLAANCIDEPDEWINKLAKNYDNDCMGKNGFSVNDAGKEPLYKAIKAAAKERIEREKRAKRTNI